MLLRLVLIVNMMRLVVVLLIVMDEHILDVGQISNRSGGFVFNILDQIISHVIVIIKFIFDESN